MDPESNVDEYDEEYLVYALFSLEEVRLEMIEDILKGTAKDMAGYHYWLADDYSTLPIEGDKGTRPPLPRTRRSPFPDSSVKAAFEYVRQAPGHLLNRKHIVVLDKKLFEERRLLRVYRMEGSEPDFDDVELEVKPGDITETAGNAHTTIMGLIGYDRGTGSWGYSVDDWRREGLPFDR